MDCLVTTIPKAQQNASVVQTTSVPIQQVPTLASKQASVEKINNELNINIFF